jgi:hypothetical protein
MRMMLKASFPTADGNRAVKDGTIHEILGKVLEQLKPEAAYFTAEDGLRTAMIFFDMKDSSDIPATCEPLFMGMNAMVELTPVMNGDDLRKGLSQLRL